MKRVQEGLFRRGHVKTLDARESEKQGRSNSGEFDGNALIIDASVRAHSGAQSGRGADNGRLQTDSVVIQAPLAGHIGGWSDKTGHLFYPRKAIQK